MPPKMLMKMLRTLLSEVINNSANFLDIGGGANAELLITSSAAVINSAFAPPPMSRKFAAFPPT